MRPVLDRRTVVIAGVAAPFAGLPTPGSCQGVSTLAGKWTYRSFINTREVAEDFAKLRLAVAEIEIPPYSGPAFAGKIVSPRWQLEISGRQAGERFQMRATQGSSNTAGWIYDYVGWIVPQWKGDAKVAQVDTLVGTVLRVVDHDDLRGGTSAGGLTYSFIAVRQG